MAEKLTQQEQVRREKMQFLVDNNIKPFGERYDRDSNSKLIKDNYDKEEFDKDYFEENTVTVKIAGRIMTKRRQGKIGFMDLKDKYGQIQIYVAKNIIGEENYEIFKKSDLGDIVGIEGHLFRTNTGQLTVKCDVYTHLSKALRPLPEKYHGLTDVEEARRRRYVDLITNEESMKRAFTRPRIIRSIQRYFDTHGFVEVETPVLQPIDRKSVV